MIDYFKYELKYDVTVYDVLMHGHDVPVTMLKFTKYDLLSNDFPVFPLWFNLYVTNNGLDEQVFLNPQRSL